jgi:oxygen-independent coproporphyrinogen-3 oxidase
LLPAVLHSLYLHIPFCRHRCAYCDFNTYAGKQSLLPAYVAALCREVEYVGGNAQDDLSVHTIYFGGGTPSLLSPGQLGANLASVRRAFELASDVEITLEANPGTVSLHDLKSMRDLGINRISLGAQSANSEELRMLERQHSFLDVMEAVSASRRAGFDNLNVDLIYGLPEQTLSTWQTTVHRVLELRPEHVSAYALTVEHGTPFGRWNARGLLPVPEADVAADMYEWLSEELEAAGYLQYEISNWAKPGHACRHNLQYWRGLPYLGLGAGGHGYAGGYRYSNTLRIQSFIDRLRESLQPESDNRHGPPSQDGGSGFSRLQFPFSPAMIGHHRQSVDDDMSEFMITGLRLTREGVNAAAFAARFGEHPRDHFPHELEELTGLGLLEWAGAMASDEPPRRRERGPAAAEAIRLTRRGRLLGNQAFMRFVA